MKVKPTLIALGAIAFMVLGFLFIKTPSPVIVVAPENIFFTGIPIPDSLGTGGEFRITNTMFTSWIVVIALMIIGLFIRRGISLVPTGFAGVAEAAVMGFYGFIEQAAGPENARKFFPLVATIFFFVLVSNYSGLLPVFNVIGRAVDEDHAVHAKTVTELKQAEIAGVGLSIVPLKANDKKRVDSHGDDHSEVTGGSSVSVSAKPDTVVSASRLSGDEGVTYGAIEPALRSAMSDMNAPLAIAIYSFIFVEIWGLQALGISYLKKFFAWDFYKKGGSGVIDIFVGILEFVSELSRIVSFTFRLFGNIFAGEVLLLMMTFLIPFLLTDVFYLLELFVGLVQAFVFAMLTTVFAATAVTAHGDHDDHDEEHGSQPRVEQALTV
jgi:F-type H+-transporting ATPase subunit a|tara:strand:- start:7805 stop:8947 length:1143 start_codon:yes stop_codon:yes gene_type:complete